MLEDFKEFISDLEGCTDFRGRWTLTLDGRLRVGAHCPLMAINHQFKRKNNCYHLYDVNIVSQVIATADNHIESWRFHPDLRKRMLEITGAK